MVTEMCNFTSDDGAAACRLTEELTAQTHLNIHFVSFRAYFYRVLRKNTGHSDFIADLLTCSIRHLNGNIMTFHGRFILCVTVRQCT